MSLERNRQTIDAIDLSILHLLKSRQKAASSIGRYKLKKGLPILDKNREQALLHKNISLAKSLNISSELASDLSQLLMRHSKKLQKKLTLKESS